MADETTTTTTTETTAQATNASAAATTTAGAVGDGKETTTTTTLLDGKASAEQGKDAGKDGKTDGKEQTGKDAKPQGAPEKYEFTLADGSAVDPAALGRFEPLFREANLNQEQASKLVNAYADMRKAEAEAWGNQVTTWGTTAKADKEIGGEGGAAFETNIRAANQVLDKFGTPELKALLGLPSKDNPTGLGLGNHPELVRLFVRLAKAAGEDKTLPGGSQAADENPALKVYKTMTK